MSGARYSSQKPDAQSSNQPFSIDSDLDVVDGQFVALIEADVGVSVAIAAPVDADRDVLEAAIADAGRELDHSLAVRDQILGTSRRFR